ncbi:MAG TPA: baseplate J/gp47 family protein, partial [Trinickia sp.]|nr:baseplate J/gp47 family protein [Trinickia sp.]
NEVAHVWQRVDSFATTGPTDRVYRLDGQSGRITFGDGRNGMIPPNGHDNVMAQSYDTAQGSAGYVAAGALTLLRPGIPGIAGVINRIAARGGVDGDTTDDLLVRGPALARANGCAVTLDDLETLAVAASPRIRRARAAESVTSTTVENASEANHGRRVEIAVLMVADEPQPSPPVELLSDVSRFVCERCLAPLVARIDVCAPVFVSINVDVTLRTAKPRDQWNALALDVAERIRDFMHPVHGGALGTGWEFGEPVRRTAFVSFLSGMSDIGIERVSALVLNGDARSDAKLGKAPGLAQTKLALPCAGTIAVQFEAG